MAAYRFAPRICWNPYSTSPAKPLFRVCHANHRAGVLRARAFGRGSHCTRQYGFCLPSSGRLAVRAVCGAPLERRLLPLSSAVSVLNDNGCTDLDSYPGDMPFAVFLGHPAAGYFGLLADSLGTALGNFVLSVSASLALGLYALQRGRHVTAGILVSLSSLKPQVSFVLVVWLIIWAVSTRQRRFLTSFTATSLLLLGGSVALLPRWISAWQEGLI